MFSRCSARPAVHGWERAASVEVPKLLAFLPVPGGFRICRHHPRVQDELSQSFDFLIFKRGNQNSNRAIQGRE
jgi:hypothetical protein